MPKLKKKWIILKKAHNQYSAQQKVEESFKAYYNGQTNEAIKLCNEAINIDSHSTSAYALRGVFLRLFRNEQILNSC